jgi:uncharacterized protein|tara:strand:+ start:403 stop:642 length:240 start_codon:yes stop_codon:yes gene_type:complete
MDKVAELIKLIASSLVDKPEEVEINEVSGDTTTVYELKVAQEDLGKIIGKQGKTAKAMRILLGAAAAKDKRRAVLEIVE